MGLDLCAEAEQEAAFGEVLQVPRGLRRLHRRTREGYGDGGAELHLASLVGRYGQRQEAVVFGLAGPQAGETEVFGGAGRPVYLFEVVAFCSESGVEFHGLVLRDEEQLARGLAAFEVAVGLLYVGELVGAADPDVQVVLPDPGEEALGAPQKLFAVGRVELEAGRVRKRLPFWLRTWGSRGSTGPLDAPKSTM